MEGHWVTNHSHVCFIDPLETVCANKDQCSMKGMLLPLFFEDSWPVWVRIVLYLTGIIYSFLGIFMVADGTVVFLTTTLIMKCLTMLVFMCAIDSITSKTKKVEL